MQHLPINKATIENRLKDLGDCILELKKLAQISSANFTADTHNTALASFYLQRAVAKTKLPG